MSRTARQARLLAAALDDVRKAAYGHFASEVHSGADPAEAFDRLIRDRDALDSMQERFGAEAEGSVQ